MWIMWLHKVIFCEYIQWDKIKNNILGKKLTLESNFYNLWQKYIVFTTIIRKKKLKKEDTIR